MENVIDKLLVYGPLGIMVVMMAYEIVYLQKSQREDRDKFSKSIDQNTSAFHALKDIINQCQNIHRS